MSRALVMGKTWFATLLLCTLVLTAFTAISKAADDWANYTPVYSLGSGDDNWWISYPAENPSSGSAVDHPQWVLDDLKSKPIVILVRSLDCKACKLQKGNMDKIIKEYSNEINFIDMVSDNDIRRANDLLDIYNPSGGSNYVPTTVFITLVKGPDGKVSAAWHSTVDAMDENALRSYIKDAIYYWHQNSPNWKP